MDVVTGAFGYIGKYIAKRLLTQGRDVCTITTHPTKPNPFGNSVKAYPYAFNDPAVLTQTLSGAETLYNTYWIRFEYGELTYEKALENTRILFECAKKAGVKRIVHISATHASVDSDLPYYRAKGLLEAMLSRLGVPYAIVRPTVVFGAEDILINNIAWMIRTFPVFPVPGSGRYRMQPVFVEDLAEITVAQAAGPSGVTIDAVGPEILTYEEIARLIAQRIGRKPLFLYVPPIAGILGGRLLGFFLRDVVLTRNELRGLMREYLTSSQTPNATTRFSEWLEANKTTVGTRYSSEIARHFRWPST